MKKNGRGGGVGESGSGWESESLEKYECVTCACDRLTDKHFGMCVSECV